MWAQIIKMRVKPGREGQVLDLLREIWAYDRAEPGYGLLRSTLMRDQKDPNLLYAQVIFESEEKARAREQDPRRQAMLQGLQAKIRDIVDGPREFVDLDVVEEFIPGAS
jgi:quinol monooxygenase YgiN